MLLPRRLSGFFSRKIQGIPIYRWVARLLRSSIEVKEADEEDLIRIHPWPSPGDREISHTHNSHATNFVAKKRRRIIDVVQLVRHPEGNHPLVGYWLFSLKVRTLYRGTGIGEMLCRLVME